MKKQKYLKKVEIIRKENIGKKGMAFKILSVGWIPGLGIEINFLYGRFLYFKKLYPIKWIMLILGI